MILLPTLYYAVGRDQGLFSFVADLMLQGKLPYRDVWEIKPPLIYLTYALFQWLLGPGPMAIHLPDRALQLLVVMLLSLIGSRLRGKSLGVLAGLWYLCLYVRGGYYCMGQAEAYATVFGVAAAWLFIWHASFGQPLPPFPLAAVGLAVGISFAYKPTAGLAFFPFLLFALLGSLWPWQKPRARAKTPVAALWLLIPFLLPQAAMLLWMHQVGILQSFLEIQSAFVLPYARLEGLRLSFGDVLLRQGLPILYAFALPVLLGVIGFFSLWRAPGQKQARRLLLIWTLFSLGSALIQKRLFLYHLLPFFLPFSLLAAEGTLAASRLLRSAARGGAPLQLAICLPLLWLIAVRGSHYADFLRYAAGARSEDQWHANFGHPSPGEFYYPALLQAAKYLARTTRPGDPVFIWGFEPYVYVAARRYPPTRFAINPPLAAVWPPPAWRQELLADLRRTPPVVILVVHNDVLPLATGFSADSHGLLKSFPQLQRFLAANYRFVRRIEDYSFYRLKDARVSRQE